VTGKLSVSDILQIQRTLSLFAHTLDNREEDLVHLVFTPDATIENSRGTGHSATGFEECRAFIRAMTPDTADHQTVDPIVLLHEDGTVRVRSRYIAVLPDGVTHNGDYLDIVRFTAEGWRIAYRMTVPRFPHGPRLELQESFLEAWRTTPERLVEIVP
jgi:hypothetical protein